MKRIFTLLLTISIFISCANFAGATATGNILGYKMYPNPLSGDILNINFSFDNKQGVTYTFTISNIIGQAVYTHILTDDEIKKGYFSIDVENFKLDKGIYLTKMTNGGANNVQKLVVR
ncbi:MAG: T9SS type A sorting domain-containing protein [Bacteroidetes bacterium]|nr:T9SS type A sorting domain-containing protein [Bacteroidota bacterium]